MACQSSRTILPSKSHPFLRFALTLTLLSDPDIEHIPFLAISTAFFNSLWSSYYRRTMLFDRFSAGLVSFQHKLFYIVLAFGRFNLYANAYGFLIRKAFDTRKARGGRWSWWLEVIGVAFFWCWFGALLKGCGTWTNALIYLIVSHVVTSPLHVQVRRAADKITHHSLQTFLIDCAFTFLHVHGRPRSYRVVPSSPAQNDHRRYMSLISFLRPRWPSPSGHPPSLPSSSASQLA